MTHPPTDRIRATVQGLCVGDAMSWPSWWHRLGQLPPRRAFRLEQAAAHTRAADATSVPTPYLQSSPVSTIDAAGPTDDVEWFVVAVRHHLGQQLDGTPGARPGAVWRELAELRSANPTAVRGRLGTTEALANLANGLEPPTSGNDNVHYFDDLAMVRAIAAGLLRPGSPDRAAALAESDASVTNAHDGVFGARAIAALIARAVVGDTPAEVVRAAQQQLPPGSWIAAVVEECLALTATEETAGVSGASPDPIALAAALERQAVDHIYAFANQAPETLGLLLAHLLVARDGRDLLLGGLAHPRHADGLVPLAGAVAGAVFGDQGGPPLPRLRGVCIEALSGVELEHVLERIVEAADDHQESAERGEPS